MSHKLQQAYSLFRPHHHRQPNGSSNEPALEDQASSSPEYAPPTRRASEPNAPSPAGRVTAEAPPPVAAPARRSSASSSSDELPLAVRDAVFAYQLRQPRPCSVVPGTILAAGICRSPRDAATVHAGLVREGVLRTSPRDGSDDNPGANEGEGEGEDYLPDTGRITAALPRSVRVLTRPAVRNLIKLLFFWEEETVRLRLLGEEEAELRGILRGLEERATGLEAELLARRSLDGGGGRGEQRGDGEGGDEAGREARADGGEVEELREEKEKMDKMAGEVEFRIQAVRLRRRIRPGERTVEDQLPKYNE